jgi:hypothetical protein
MATHVLVPEEQYAVRVADGHLSDPELCLLACSGYVTRTHTWTHTHTYRLTHKYARCVRVAVGQMFVQICWPDQGTAHAHAHIHTTYTHTRIRTHTLTYTLTHCDR